MSFDIPDTDTVYVDGLPLDVSEKEIAEYFGSIGVIKVDKKARRPKIWLYRDKQSGGLKGDGTVTYEDPYAAASAVQWFDNKEFKGSMLHVSLAQRKDSTGFRVGPSAPPSLPVQPIEDPPSAATNPIPPAPVAPHAPVNLGSDQPSALDVTTGVSSTSGIPGGPGGAEVPSKIGADESWFSKQGNNQEQWVPNVTSAAPGDGSTHLEQYPQGYEQQAGADQAGYSSSSTPAVFQSSWGVEMQFGRGRGGRGGGPEDSAGRGRGGGNGGRKINAAPQGPPGLFGPDDWPCPSCGNTNWARRPRCNLCGAPKPGTVDMKREGQAGGFKELDEKEIEEAKRRRKELEADDEELYDDYGRVKKKYRSVEDRAAREAAALARLRGDYDPSPSGQELEMMKKAASSKREGESSEKEPIMGSANDKEKDRKERDQKEPKESKDREREKEREKDRDKERDKDRSRKRGKEHEKDRGRERHRSRSWDRDRRKQRSRSRQRERHHR